MSDFEVEKSAPFCVKSLEPASEEKVEKVDLQKSKSFLPSYDLKQPPLQPPHGDLEHRAPSFGGPIGDQRLMSDFEGEIQRKKQDLKLFGGPWTLQQPRIFRRHCSVDEFCL